MMVELAEERGLRRTGSESMLESFGYKLLDWDISGGAEDEERRVLRGCEGTEAMERVGGSEV